LCRTRPSLGFTHPAAGHYGGMLGLIIYLLVVGVIAGYLARLLVPGADPMGFWATVALGIIGSFVGGVLGYVIFNEDLDQGALQPSGIIGSLIGAVIALLIYRAISGGSSGTSRTAAR
jgi:uncharacterized membrane protein YeaQ/YmgE (transglycosylase-associated protein family)